MALINCPECKTEISDKAKSCPHCGNPLNQSIGQSKSENVESKSLELLFEYTKFHIGVYLTLTASYVTIATVKVNNHLLLTLR